MNIFSGSDDEIIMHLEHLTAQMKKEQHPAHHGFYCYLQCLKANEIIMIDDTQLDAQDKKQYIEKLETTGWELRDFFVNTPLKTVSERQQTLPDELQPTDLVEMFSKMKSELHLDLVTLIEDQLLEERDAELRTHFIYLFQDGIGIDDIDEEEDEEDEKIKNMFKRIAYENILLRDYFSKSSGVTGIENFIEDAYEQGSLFLALEKTRNRTLPKTVKTRRDRFRFYQLIERYITFSDTYSNQQEDVLRNILEFGTKILKMNIYQPEFAHAKGKLIDIMLHGIIHHYQSTNFTPGFAVIMEYVLCCLTPCLVTQQTVIMDEAVTYTGRTPHKETKKILTGIWKILFENTIYIDDGFYHTYPQRFTLEEFRIRNEAMDLIEDQEIYDAEKLLKQLTKHTSFFRYIFNMYSLQFYKLLFTSIDYVEADNQAAAIKNIELAKQTLHERRTFIINEYPPVQIKDKLNQIDDHDLYIEQISCQIYGISFDEQAYRSKKTETHKKIGRNEPCPCGSGKKHKKCCGNVQ